MRGVRTHRLLRLFPVAARAPAFDRDTGHTVVASFEPGEDWFWDFANQEVVEGPRLAPPHYHPLEQPVPGPAGRVPPDWMQRLR